jgi:PAS domain S-box-containing protein
MLPDCRSRLGWDLPDSPSAGKIHEVLIALKREIVTALENEYAGNPHLLVKAICELEDALDTVLGFLLEEEKRADRPDLLKVGEELSRRYAEDVISIYDPEGNLVYLSPTIENILGYTPSEWRQEGPRLMIRNPVYEAGDQAHGSHGPANVSYMVVIPHRKGGDRIVQVEERLLHGPGRAIIGLWTRMQDVSLRENLKKELADTYRKYREIFEEAADVMFVLDPGGKLQSVNRRFRDLTGFSSDYFAGKPLDALLHKDDRERCRAEIEKLLMGQTVEFEARIFSLDGSHIVSSFRCKSLRNHGGKGISIGIARDISEKKRMEEELEKKVELLERFRRASTDRELRIKELIEELERVRGGAKSD